jgi:hypothetical protein
MTSRPAAAVIHCEIALQLETLGRERVAGREFCSATVFASSERGTRVALESP